MPAIRQPLIAFTVNGLSEGGSGFVESLVKSVQAENPGANLALASVEGGFVVAADEEFVLREVREQVAASSDAEVSGIGVCYRETIRTASEAEGKYLRQTGGRGNFGHCVIRLEPGKLGSGITFANRLEANQIPAKYVDAIEEGVKESLASGVRAGRPITDVKAALIDGSWHDTDSNEDAFRHAGALAAEVAGKNAQPVLLEPVMEVEFVAAEEELPAVTEEIHARRGRIVSTDEVFLAHEVVASLPLAELLNEGSPRHADWQMRFKGYEVVPGWDEMDGEVGLAVPRWPHGPEPRTDRASERHD